MIRLAVIGEEVVSWREIDSRLRGATTEASLSAELYAEPAAACHAVAYVGALRPDRAEVERLLRAGKHVLLATEPSLTWRELESLWATARHGFLQLSVVNPDRYLPSRQLIREQLGQKLGAAGLVRVHPWEARPELRTDSSLGLPGPLIAYLDLVHWLAGGPPSVVYAVEQGGGEYVQVHLGLPGGGMALLDYTRRLPAGDSYQSLSVIAASGAAYADDQHNAQLLYRGGRAQAVAVEERTRQRTLLLQEFVDALTTGCDLSANAATWRHVYATADAARQSLRTRRAVPLLEGR